MMAKRSKWAIICLFLVLLGVNVFLISRYRKYKSDPEKENEQSISADGLDDGVTFLPKNNLDDSLVFHKIDPLKLPDSKEYGGLYRYLYVDKPDTLAEPNAHSSVIINGQGCYVFEGISRLCLGIYNSLTKDDENNTFVNFNILDKEEKLAMAKVLVLKEIEGKIVNSLLLFYEVNENKVYEIYADGEKINLRSEKSGNLLKKGQPVMVGVEERDFDYKGKKVRGTTLFFILGSKESVLSRGYELNYKFDITQ